MNHDEHGIYAITNVKTGCIYIGKTSVSFKKRFYSHVVELNGNYHANKLLQRDWNILGNDCFSFSAIEVTDNLIDRERYWIDFYKEKSYNTYGASIIALRRKQNPVNFIQPPPLDLFDGATKRKVKNPWHNPPRHE